LLTFFGSANKFFGGLTGQYWNCFYWNCHNFLF
jgi:hypothetical protein